MDGKDLIDWLYIFLTNEGKHTYTPDEVKDVFLKHINEIYEGIDNKWYKKDW